MKSKKQEILSRKALILIIYTLILYSIGIYLVLRYEKEFKVISPLSDSAGWSSRVYAEAPQDKPTDVIRRVAGRHAERLIMIAKCESSLNPRAVGPTQDYGLFQIHLPSHWKRIPGKTAFEKQSWLLDVNNNTFFAYTLFLEQGVAPWRSSSRCHGL